MTVYEKRIYSLNVGQMAEVTRLYSEEGYPVLEAEGFLKNLVGYFISDTGRLHQIIHIWRFENDEVRRAFWKKLYASEKFMSFVVKLRPLIDIQDVQLMISAPWGPQP